MITILNALSRGQLYYIMRTSFLLYLFQCLHTKTFVIYLTYGIEPFKIFCLKNMFLKPTLHFKNSCWLPKYEPFVEHHYLLQKNNIFQVCILTDIQQKNKLTICIPKNFCVANVCRTSFCTLPNFLISKTLNFVRIYVDVVGA